MKLRNFRQCLLVGWLLGCLTTPTRVPANDAPFPTIEELLPKVIERAKRSNKSPAGYDFTRTKTSTHYDSDHEITKQEEKVYRITEKNGKPKALLISKDGEPPPARPTKNDATNSKLNSRGRTGDRSQGNDSLLTHINDDIIKRFSFAVTNREVVEGRTTLVIDVKPKKDVKISSMEEEVLAQVAGRIWIDEADHEVVQANMSLQDSVKIGWGGMLGALREFRFSVSRLRLSGGVWINSKTDLWLHFRQLFSTKRMEISERVTDVVPAMIPPRGSGPAATE